jgi:glutamate racemase
VFATPATIGKNAFGTTLSFINNDFSVHSVACPMFVPLIEGGYIADDCKVTRLIAAEYIEKLKGTNVDTLILGCTHYPIIKNLIGSVAREVLGYDITIIDSGYEAALATKEMLCKKGILGDRNDGGKIQYYVSDETQNFSSTASLFLGEDAGNVTKVSIG